MLFEEIIGQNEVKASLQQMLASQRAPHALLLLGTEGCGQLPLAIAMAQSLLCIEAKEGLACGQCNNCNKSSKFIHSDIHFSFPTVGGKAVSNHFLSPWREALKENPYMNAQQWLQLLGAENKQGNITKDECVDIVKKLSLKTFEGGKKVLLLWMPEYLGKEGNRLLKLIEEPPENTHFILVAEHQELILNTILSRCQLVKVRPLQDEEIISALEARNIAPEHASSVAYLANGSFNEALTLLENNENDNAQLFLQWLRICWAGKANELVQWADDFAKIGRENQKYLCRYGLFFLREFSMMQLTGEMRLRLRPAELKTAQNMQKVMAYHQVVPITALLNDAVYHIERNANAKILMMDTSLKVHRILKNKKKVEAELKRH